MSKTLSNNSITFEVLISTMDRTSLSFVEKMFPNNKLENLNLLIINQTKKGNECISKFDNIKVINSYEMGLSKSRNLALENATGDICFIADDDVEYVEGFQDIVKEAYQRISNASVILFKIGTFTGENYKLYPKKSKQLITRNNVKPASSIEMTFKRAHIVDHGIAFNTLFGLGGYFTSGEEYLFLKDVLKQNLNVYFENKTIVKHSLERSTSDVSSNNYIKTISALNYFDFKNFSYLLLVKYILYLLKHKLIGYKDVIAKFRIGVNAINECRKLIKTI
ncbi:glycosyl transferase family 2 [Algibacter marinivivus]|uniref:Glycosyl transferase family 2 n=1 Tax=Algibacter marinivivus TaxID=2100723 RepID=A0A2U2X203_9FLAO|nr:glycosyltransferase family A protein [Algibacter marinivivus]PWH81807.1 glycosyl transferase family 2 [Algibacter marinivivus]